ncbi:MAG: 2-phosphosulfolactate phosphatase [candidate division Zixibacteria bacterium]|nr:2-phosphosulfolactate phosphatase [candidate division Zixibacteria bacterium]
MDIRVNFTSVTSSPRMVERRGVIVIDVLRASSTLTAALANGAEKIIPVDSVMRAQTEVKRYPKNRVLLCGERGYDKLEGFDLGNSPVEYNRDAVSGKTIIYTSTNGTRGISIGTAGKILILGSFTNFPRPADYLMDINTDISIICCGNSGVFSLEDAVCGGMFVHYITKSIRSVTTNDAAEAAVALFKRYRDSIPQMMEMCENGRQLALHGYHEDVVYCSRVGITDVVPVLQNGELTPLEKRL